MATAAVTPTPLVRDTMSADILDADGVASTTASDGWVVAAPVAPDVDILLKFLADASGDTVSIKAGDKPPAERAGLGDLDLVLAASDVRYIMVEKARFMQDDGTLLITATDAGTTCYAWTIPKDA